jgi:hypothetical protein
MYNRASRKSYFKFWWSEELDCLKDNAMQSSSIWKEAGKPRNGLIFNQYRSDKQAYGLAIRQHKDDDARVYSNHLHDMLVEKQGPRFWSVWRSKFGAKDTGVTHVDGVADNRIIVDKFVTYFQKACNNVSSSGSSRLCEDYSRMRQEYSGDPNLKDHNFDACLVERVKSGMKRGKAAGLDNLSAEHLQQCHSLLSAVLAKLFNLIVLTGYIPTGFGYSYTTYT